MTWLGISPQTLRRASAGLLAIALIILLLDTLSSVVSVMYVSPRFDAGLRAGLVALKVRGEHLRSDIPPGFQIVPSIPDWQGYRFPRLTGFGDFYSVALKVPIWPLAFLAGSCAILLFGLQSSRKGRCAECGYPVVHAASKTCPECGKHRQEVGRESTIVRFWRANRKLLISAAVLVAANCTTALLTGFIALVATKEVTIVIPKGYRGDAVVAKDPSSAAPIFDGRSVRFIIPTTGLLWASETNYLQRYGPHFIRCVEDDGTILSGNQSVNGGTWFFTQGPMGDQQVYIISIRDNEGNTEPFIPGQSFRGIIDNGIPRDFVPPHVLRNDAGSKLP
ncbi:MAG: hypothetical protein JNM86_06385 [Phycisphaerae bacterium]|nr:hypothetical protein [Phycisphaerae bacterium]